MNMTTRRPAFTLIELLVVIAVIAVLIGVLLPALSKSRETARAIKCSASLRSVAQAVTAYTGEFRTYPPSYVYGDDETSLNWELGDQDLTNPNPQNGYVHWSAALFNNGSINDEAFKCPTMPFGGAPATNPGGDSEDWERGQVNDLGGGPGTSSPRDRQVSRIAYTGNDAIFPRNKLNPSDRSTPRKSQLVNPSWVEGSARGASGTILATEFAFSKTIGYATLADSTSVDGFVIKSHRPVTPFIGLSTGTDVFNEPLAGATYGRFVLPQLNDFLREEDIAAGMLGQGNTPTILNAVGRHHPGGQDRAFGGSANFAFVDGSVRQKTVLQTVRDREWGERFFSMTGSNLVDLRPRAGDP